VKVFSRVVLALAILAQSVPTMADNKPLIVVGGQMQQIPAATTLNLNASTIAPASINLPHATAPTMGGATIGPVKTSFMVVASMTTAQANVVLAAAAALPGSTVDFQPNAAGFIPVTSQGVNSGKCYNEAYGLILRNATDITLDFHGATLQHQAVDTPTYSHTLCLDSNTRLKVRNGSIDWLNLPFSQGVITSVQTTTRPYSLTFTPTSGYVPAFTSIQRVYQFNQLGSNNGDWVNNIWDRGGANSLPLANNGDGTYTIQSTSPLPFVNTPTAGMSVVLNGQIYHADGVRLYGNRGVTFDNFTVYAAAGMGFEAYGWVTGQLSQSDITFLNGSGVRIKSGTTRIQSTNADCIHMQAVRGKVSVSNGFMEGCEDDGLNVYDFGSAVTTVTNTSNFVIDNGRAWVLGDKLRFIDASGVIQGTALLTTVALVSGGPTATVVMTTAAPAGLAIGWTVENDTESPTLLFSNNRVGKSRGHGVIANARESKITGNWFHDINGTAAIHVVMHRGGFNQSVNPTSVDIDSNKFERVNMPSPGFTTGGLDAGVIFIDVTATDGVTETATGQLPNVTIRNNSFTYTAASGIYASGIKSGDISNNYFANWGMYPSNPYPSAAFYHNNTTCAISIWAAGGPNNYLNIGQQTYGTTTNPYVCDNKTGLSAASPAGEGVLIH
jgi:hypothetical protein